MPDAHAHATANLMLSASMALAGIAEPRLLPVAAGAWLGSLLHPDLDATDTAYGLLHSHRGISHIPIIGTLERTAWFLGPALLLAWQDVVEWEVPLLIFVGLCLSDVLHIILDWRF